jgi:hypothetical protein
MAAAAPVAAAAAGPPPPPVKALAGVTSECTVAPPCCSERKSYTCSAVKTSTDTCQQAERESAVLSQQHSNAHLGVVGMRLAAQLVEAAARGATGQRSTTRQQQRRRCRGIDNGRACCCGCCPANAPTSTHLSRLLMSRRFTGVGEPGGGNANGEDNMCRGAAPFACRGEFKS